MRMIDKIDMLMREKNINLHQLAQQTDVKYTTMRNWYDRPDTAENAKLASMRKIANYFGVSLDYIADDSVEDRYYGFPSKKEPANRGELQKELNDVFINLPPEKQQEALNYVHYLEGHSKNA